MTSAMGSKKCCRINVIVSGGVPFFAVLSRIYSNEMSGSNACAATRFGRTVEFEQQSAFQENDLI
jgi:hypothetical protein